MLKRLLLVATLSVASVVLAASGQIQPLKVKTGLWHMTASVTWPQVPPRMAAMMGPHTTSYDSCVTANDLSTNPWAKGSSDNCTWTVLKSTGTDMEVQGTECAVGDNFGMTAEIHGRIHIVDSENGTGTMTITLAGNGQTMNGLGSYTGKWMSANCAAQ
ncbi:MAG TPA: DUF3617 family protein [Steroidobacteraceae bacterium]